MQEHLARFGQVISGAQSCNAYAAWALRNILPLDETQWYRSCDVYLNALTMAQGSSRLIHDPLGGYRFHANNLTLRNSLDVGVRERAVLFHPGMYRAVRSFVGDERYGTYRPKLPCYHWLHRLLSFRLNPSHPFATIGSRRSSPIASRLSVENPSALSPGAHFFWRDWSGAR